MALTSGVPVPGSPQAPSSCCRGVFILPGFRCTSCIGSSVSAINLGKFPLVVTSNMSSALFFSFWYSSYMYVAPICYCPTVLGRFVFVIFALLFSWISVWRLSLDLSSASLILPSAVSSLLTSPVRTLFISVPVFGFLDLSFASLLEFPPHCLLHPPVLHVVYFSIEPLTY